MGRGSSATRAEDDTRSVPKEQPPTPVTEATDAGTGTYNRSHLIRYSLPLRDDQSMPGASDETQYHLSPTSSHRDGPVHSTSTMRLPNRPGDG